MSNGDPVLEQNLTPELVPPVAGRLAPSPYSFELTASEAIRLTVHNSKAGVVVAVHVRVLHPQRGIITSVYQYAPTSDRAADWDDWVIGEGYLLNVTAYTASGSPRRGQTFIRLQIVRGTGAAQTILGTLLQGYVTGNQDLAWPGSPLLGSLEGDGYSRNITGTDPAAGTPILETVPTGARWRLRAARVAFVTSATVASRTVYLQLLNDASISIGWSNHRYTQGASDTSDYFWAGSMPLEVAPVSNKSVVGLPDLIATAGFYYNLSALNLQPGDNFGPPQFVVDEWLEAQ